MYNTRAESIGTELLLRKDLGMSNLILPCDFTFFNKKNSASRKKGPGFD